MGYTTIHRKRNKALNIFLPIRKQTNTSVVYNKPQFMADTHVPRKRKMANNITDVLSNGQWKGQRCFIIGGGPSVSNLDFKTIENEMTIGINKSFTKFPTKICYCMDLKFYDYITYEGEKEEERLVVNKQWKDYQGIKIFLQPTGATKNKFKFDENIYVINRIAEKKISFDLTEGIYGGSNSGLGALLLACCLGASPIYLFGFDMKVNRKNSKTHFHSGYPKQNIGSFAQNLSNYKDVFYEFAPMLRQCGVQVININIDKGTDLRCFDVQSFSDI